MKIAILLNYLGIKMNCKNKRFRSRIRPLDYGFGNSGHRKKIFFHDMDSVSCIYCIEDV